MQKRRAGEGGGIAIEPEVPLGLGDIGTDAKLVVLVQTFVRELRAPERNLQGAFENLAEAYRHIENLCQIDKGFARWCLKTPIGGFDANAPDQRQLRDILFQEIFDAYFGADYPTLKREYHVLCGIYDTERKRAYARFRHEYFVRECYLAKEVMIKTLTRSRSKEELVALLAYHMSSPRGIFISALLMHAAEDVVSLIQRSRDWAIGRDQQALRGPELAQWTLEAMVRNFREHSTSVAIDALLRVDGTIFDGRFIATVLEPFDDTIAREILIRETAMRTFRLLYAHNSDITIWKPAFEFAFRNAYSYTEFPTLMLAYELHKQDLLTSEDAAAVVSRFVRFVAGNENAYKQMPETVDWMWRTMAEKVTDSLGTTYLRRAILDNIRDFDMLKRFFFATESNEISRRIWSAMFGDYYLYYRWRPRQQWQFPSSTFPFDAEFDRPLSVAIFFLRRLTTDQYKNMRPTPDQLTALYFYATETNEIDNLNPDDAAWVQSLAKRPAVAKRINNIEAEE